ncbi:hypothetical protein GQ42DRAFT_159506 [Ramicandelaber brevisporus]|nr:hypothetical protein GQ42DRAFT_159506 [Ramicandelaber brevisporus]
MLEMSKAGMLATVNQAGDGNGEGDSGGNNGDDSRGDRPDRNDSDWQGAGSGSGDNKGDERDQGAGDGRGVTREVQVSTVAGMMSEVKARSMAGDNEGDNEGDKRGQSVRDGSCSGHVERKFVGCMLHRANVGSLDEAYNWTISEKIRGLHGVASVGDMIVDGVLVQCGFGRLKDTESFRGARGAENEVYVKQVEQANKSKEGGTSKPDATTVEDAAGKAGDRVAVVYQKNREVNGLRGTTGWCVSEMWVKYSDMAVVGFRGESCSRNLK